MMHAELSVWALCQRFSPHRYLCGAESPGSGGL